MINILFNNFFISAMYSTNTRETKTGGCKTGVAQRNSKKPGYSHYVLCESTMFDHFITSHKTKLIILNYEQCRLAPETS